MVKLLATFGLLLASVPLLALAAGGGDDRPEFRAELRGDDEVPPVDTEAEGRLRIRFDDDFSSATVRLELEDAERITQAHFHCGEEGVNGPAVISLAGFHERGWDIDGRWLDDVTITDRNIVDTACGSTLREIAEAMEAGRIYVNAHSVANPTGEVRGQVEMD